MKAVVVEGMLLVAVLIGAGAGYFFGQSNLQTRTLINTTTETKTTGSTVTTLVTVTSFYPDLGSYLLLRIEMNASAIRSHGAIWAQVILSNPLSSNLTAAVPYSSSSTVSTWSGYDFLCGGGSLRSIVSFAVFPGVWGTGNISLAGEPLALAPPVQPPCVISITPLALIYLPSGSTASAYSSYPPAPSFVVHTVLDATTGLCPTTSSGGRTCGPSTSLFGYWSGPVSGPDGNYTTSSPDFHYFAAGSYTIAAEDAWGHQAFSYFEVA